MEKEVRMAAPKKLSAGQIINQLRRAEVALANGKRVKQVCRELGVSEQTYYRWRKEYGGMKVSQASAKRLKQGVREAKPATEAGGGQHDFEGSVQGKLLSPERCRRCVVHMRQRLGVSERKACRVLGQARSTQRRIPKRREDEEALRQDVVKVARRGDLLHTRSSPELCVKVRGSSSMLRLGCLGDLLGLEE